MRIIGSIKAVDRFLAVAARRSATTAMTNTIPATALCRSSASSHG